MRKMLLAAFMFALFGLVSASSISGYEVSPTVSLNQDIIITGFYLDDMNMSNNQLCSFYITNVDGNETYYRASDEYTDLLGKFYSRITITEPRFLRGEDYNVLSICQRTTASKTFTVGNRQTADQPLLWELKWIFSEENIFPLIYVGIIFFVVVVGLALVARRIMRGW